VFTTMYLVAKYHMAFSSSINDCPWWHDKKEGLSVLQGTSTCWERWLVWFDTLTTVLLTTWVIWDVMFCHLVCRSWHLQGSTMLQNFRQYPPSLTAPHSRRTASFNMNWCYATCDVMWYRVLWNLAFHDRHSAVWWTDTDDSEEPALPIFYHKHQDSNLYYIQSS